MDSAESICREFHEKTGIGSIRQCRRSYWKGHAKWLIDPKRKHDFDLYFDKDDQRGQVVHKSGRRPLKQDEIWKLIEKAHRIGGRGVPSQSGRTVKRFNTKPKNYDIGNGSSYVYAYYYPEYRKKGKIDYPIKIGRSIDYRERINTQNRATGMPEDLEVAVVWRTDKPEEAERLQQGILHFRGKHKSDAPGIEWFWTSPDEIRQIIEGIQPGALIRDTGGTEDI